MAPRSTTAAASTTTKARAGGAGRATRGTGGGVSYAERDDDDEFGGAGAGTGAQEEDDEDPVSTAELQKVIRAFSKGRANKDKSAALKVGQQVESLLSSTDSAIKSVIKSSLAKMDLYVSSLELENDHLPSLGDQLPPEQLKDLVDKQEEEVGNELSIVEDILEELEPDNNPFYGEVKEALQQRPQLAKKQYRKLRKTAESEFSDQVQMAELYKEAGPMIVKGFKLAMS